jgi:hypothetical protein
MGKRSLGVGASIVAVIWACGGTSSDKFGDGGIDANGGDGGGVTDGSPIFGDSSVSDAGKPDADGGNDCCPANAQYIYITGQGAQLWSFWPPTFTFKLVGTLSCTASRRT